ncbi:MAG: hypothetical protein OHK0053_03640 [Microscillaceae bacterium]
MGVLHLAGPGRAQEIPPRPEPSRFVNDFANLLQAVEMEALEIKLRNYQDSTSTQIAIVIIPSLNGQAIESYSVQLAQSWGIGQEGKDNGLLILMAVQDRKVRIEVGYGLEDRLPDLAAKSVIDRYMIPNFKEARYYNAFEEATSAIISYLSGAFMVEDGDKVSRTSTSTKSIDEFLINTMVLTIVFIFIIIVFALAFSRRGRRGGTYSSGRSSYRGGSIYIGSSYSDSSSSYSDSSSSYSDSSSFGGGDFGGGGASGDW